MYTQGDIKVLKTPRSSHFLYLKFLPPWVVLDLVGPFCLRLPVLRKSTRGFLLYWCQFDFYSHFPIWFFSLDVFVYVPATLILVECSFLGQTLVTSCRYRDRSEDVLSRSTIPFCHLFVVSQNSLVIVLISPRHILSPRLSVVVISNLLPFSE